MACPSILRDFNDITRDPPPYVSGWPDGSLYHWKGVIIGPEDTPYESGIFYLSIDFAQDHPFTPPHITFTTPIYHPNISRNGEICLDILHDKWGPFYRISAVLISIVSFLDDPNPDCNFNPLIEYQYIYDRKTFDKIAREWTRKYAI